MGVYLAAIEAGGIQCCLEQGVDYGERAERAVRPHIGARRRPVECIYMAVAGQRGGLTEARIEGAVQKKYERPEIAVEIAAVFQLSLGRLRRIRLLCWLHPGCTGGTSFLPPTA